MAFSSGRKGLDGRDKAIYEINTAGTTFTIALPIDPRDLKSIVQAVKAEVAKRKK